MAGNDSKSESEESNRMWASASFVGVLIIVGLPLWWKTTEVYRVALPYDKIASLDTSSHMVVSDLTVLANDEQTASTIARSIELAFKDSDIIKLRIRTEVLTSEVSHHMNTIADDLDALELVSETLDLGEHNHMYLVQRKPLAQEVWMSTERAVFFRDEKSIPTIIQVLDKWVYQLQVLRGSRSERAGDAARRTRFPAGPGYHVVLSVVHPRPEAMVVHLDAAHAVEDYVGSFVDELSGLHNFTLKSQWLHLLDFDFQAKEVKDATPWGRHFEVREDRLHLLLTRLEERAATHVSQLPTVHLVVYALPCDRAPMVLKRDADASLETPHVAFMSPRWGGVYIGSPTHAECREHWSDKTKKAQWNVPVKQIMGTLIAQLRPLIGIVDVEPIPGAHLESLRSVSPRTWEVDSLLRIRSLEQLTSAALTVQSLAQLLGEISNIVINDEVGESINGAVADAASAAALLASGALAEAYARSQRAFAAAEAAFTDPSLLALLYFPDDQKYAIYIPLFLPVMFPVLLSTKNLFRWLRRSPSSPGAPVTTGKEDETKEKAD